MIATSPESNHSRKSLRTIASKYGFPIGNRRISLDSIQRKIAEEELQKATHLANIQRSLALIFDGESCSQIVVKPLARHAPILYDTSWQDDKAVIIPGKVQLNPHLEPDISASAREGHPTAIDIAHAPSDVMNLEGPEIKHYRDNKLQSGQKQRIPTLKNPPFETKDVNTNDIISSGTKSNATANYWEKMNRDVKSEQPEFFHSLTREELDKVVKIAYVVIAALAAGAGYVLPYLIERVNYRP